VQALQALQGRRICRANKSTDVSPETTWSQPCVDIRLGRPKLPTKLPTAPPDPPGPTAPTPTPPGLRHAGGGGGGEGPEG
jgi:hypothetical protein